MEGLHNVIAGKCTTVIFFPRGFYFAHQKIIYTTVGPSGTWLHPVKNIYLPQNPTIPWCFAHPNALLIWLFCQTKMCDFNSENMSNHLFSRQKLPALPGLLWLLILSFQVRLIFPIKSNKFMRNKYCLSYVVVRETAYQIFLIKLTLTLETRHQPSHFRDCRDHFKVVGLKILANTNSG